MGIEVTGREHDLGAGMTLREFLNAEGELVGYTVAGPAAPACPSPYQGRCGGLCAVRPHTEHERTYSVWTVTGEWPNLTFSPSVNCDCSGQHGWIRDGRWVSA